MELVFANMRILVAYYSETGNTKKVAEAIHGAALINEDAELRRIQDVSPEDLGKFNLLILGSPCHDADLARPFKQFLDSLPHNPPFKFAGFFTHATFTPEQRERRKELFAEWAGKCGPTFVQTCQEKGITFLGYFHCMGAASAPIEAFIHRTIITDEAEWEEYLPELRSHPNSTDLENAKTFTTDIISKI